MALTKEQWFQKLKKWVPVWFFEESKFQEAHFRGIAAVFAQLQSDGEFNQREVFILKAKGAALEAHGDERDVDRLPTEDDTIYAKRVQNLHNQSNCVAIKALIDTFLIVGEAVIKKHDTDVIFLNRGGFLNRKQTFHVVNCNAFSILVEKQIHAPYSFFSRGNFLNRGDFSGSGASSPKVFNLIVRQVNKMKALGYVYRVIELS